MATNKTRKVTITTLNWIPALGAYGPIIYPKFINEDIVYKIVQSGFEVFEHCVTGQYAGAKVKLTISNFYNEKRFATEAKPTPTTAAATVRNFGAAVDGQAKVVDSTAKSDPVPVVVEESVAEEPVVPKTATPINNNMSKSQRRKAAKAAAAAARAAAANQENSEPGEVFDPSNTEVVEETNTDATEATEEPTETSEVTE